MADPLTVLPRRPDVSAFGAPPRDPNKPQFIDILNRLNPQTDISQSPVFKQAVDASTPSTGISPQTQQILDIIKKQQMQSQNEGIAAAQSLAAKRGITGSSTEQFGTQQAIEQAQKTGQDATTAALTNDLNQNMDLKKLQIQGLFQGAGLQLTTDTDLQKLAATLTSDQIASLNNMDFQNRSLALQQLLGEQGIQVAQQNIQAQKDIANKNSQNQLLGSILGAATPFALGKVFGTGGAGIPGLGGATGAGGFVPYSPGGLPGPYAPGAGSGAGLGAAGTAAASLGAGAAGYYVANKALGAGQPGDQGAMNTGAAIGGVGGAIIGGPAGAAVGAAAGTALGKLHNREVNGIDKSLGHTAGSAARYINPITAIPAVISKIGGGGKKEQMMGSVAWAQGLTPEEQAVQLGKPGYSVNYDSNSKGSWERNTNTLLQSFSGDALVQRYSQSDPSQFGTALDRSQKQAYDRAVQLNGGNPVTGDQFSAYLKDNSHLIKAANIIDNVFA